MTYGQRSKFGRSNFRSPRGRISSFRGRGRGGGSDSYYNSSNRDSFSDKSNFRSSSFQSSSYRGNHDHFDSRGSRSRFSGERYSNSRGRRDEEPSYHRRDIRETASGSYGREHLRRSDSESDRKRMRSDIGSSFKEGFSPRRSYDELEHSSRSYSSNSSPYRTDSSPYSGKSHSKEFNDFKRPLPPDRTSYSSVRPTRGARGRGSSSTRIVPRRIPKTPAPSYLKRSSVVSRLKTTSRLQLILRKKKQLRIMRMRKERESRLNLSSTGKSSHITDDTTFEDIEEDTDDFVEDDDIEMDEDVDEEHLEPPGVSSPERSDPKKSPKKIRKDSDTSPEKSASLSELSKVGERKYSPVKVRLYERIALKCPHCKFECKTFKTYQQHLTTHKHKTAMEKLLFNLKQKLRRLRTEQREQQRIIDERDDNFSRTSYCKLCKLNYKQTRQEHMTSDFHVSMSEFLNSKCSVCRMTFATPILYEHHRSTLTHIKRKAFLERKGALKKTDRDEDNNEDGNFMVLDSVGSADESNDEVDTSKEDGSTESSKKKSELETQTKTTIIGNEFIKKVNIYYCKLCKLCLHYNPNRDADENLLNHCRTRFHLKRFSLEDAKKNKFPKKNSLTAEGDSVQKKSGDGTTIKTKRDGEASDQFWVDDEVTVGDHKSSEDEDDSHPGNRYDRFGTSDEKDNVEKVKVEPESVDDQNTKEGEKVPTVSSSKDN